MTRILLGLVVGGVLGAGGMALARRHDEEKAAKVLSARDIREKLDGNAARATVVEVTLNPGQSGTSHRHPGPVFGYVLEGEYELGIDDQPTKVLKTGETFYEPTNCLHRVSKNPAATGKTRVLAVLVHPRDAKTIAVPEQKNE